MASVFTRIIAGELPAHWIWQDDLVVAFLTIGPNTWGHTLVVSRLEVERWTDLPAEVAARLFEVCHLVGRAHVRAFGCDRAGLVMQGYSVPHVHAHVFPTNSPTDFDEANAIQDPDEQRMSESAAAIRDALHAMGHGEGVADGWPDQETNHHE